MINKTITELEVGEEWGSGVLGGSNKEGLLAVRVSNPTDPGGIMTYDHAGKSWVGGLRRAPLVTTVEGYIPSTSTSVSWEFMNAGFEGKESPAAPDSIILLPPKPDDAKTPLIVVPHGGPHSMTHAGYIPSYQFLASLGYAVLHVNYRGSVGFGEVRTGRGGRQHEGGGVGLEARRFSTLTQPLARVASLLLLLPILPQKYLKSLPGRCGEFDVEDVREATRLAVEKHGLDPDRIGVCGGSHGGFLSGHMVGQYPDVYKVAAMRNPVTNIATMTTATDIRDWCDVEALGAYDFGNFRAAGKEELAKMYDASPCRWAKDVKGKVLVAIGMKDLR